MDRKAWQLLSIVSSTWNKTIIKTGDTNIGYLKSSDALKRYIEGIETYNFKGCVRYIFASLFLCLKESTCETRKNVFYLTLKALFVFEIIKF